MAARAHRVLSPFGLFLLAARQSKSDLLCTRSLRRLTIEVWHQTSGCIGTNNLRDVLLVPAGIDIIKSAFRKDPPPIIGMYQMISACCF